MKRSARVQANCVCEWFDRRRAAKPGVKSGATPLANEDAGEGGLFGCAGIAAE